MRVYTYIYIYHSSVDGHLGCFYILAIVNYASINIWVHVHFQITVFFFKYILKSVTAVSYDSSIFSFFTNLVALNNTNLTVEQHKSYLIVARDQKYKLGLSELLTGLHSLWRLWERICSHIHWPMALHYSKFCFHGHIFSF